MPLSTIVYTAVSKSNQESEESFSFETDQRVSLPKGGSNRAIFQSAIEGCGDDSIRKVLIDLVRFLCLGNFARAQDNVDKEFPFQGALPEAASTQAGDHLSGKTNAVGATLHLMMTTVAADDVKTALGDVVWAMVHHRKFGATEDSLAVPVIDQASLQPESPSDRVE